uniref:Uncharacterized protein n=1 Tax=Romanomermis culicivorax TaxID=13658 RepID=A0A915HT98_ROMCU
MDMNTNQPGVEEDLAAELKKEGEFSRQLASQCALPRQVDCMVLENKWSLKCSSKAISGKSGCTCVKSPDVS